MGPVGEQVTIFHLEEVMPRHGPGLKVTIAGRAACLSNGCPT
ncbi:hypothetical protein COLO4_08622 [Corchorus olitorius]|uniref:Uncharacterized protein n=1 Tax=Corchorus olitorius TaxID=93759 RepID=A0A1R3KF25_9ROSI|nr:hypothetical protein COLO4_08622 [Corchorus olitorius]